jgi:mannitol-specific phosphotransferase system IIBC component
MKTFKNIAIITLVSFVSFSTISCKKKKENEITIELTSKVEGEKFSKDEKVSIKGTITASREDIHEYTITIKNTTTGATEFSKKEHSHSKSITFDESWVNNVTEHSDLVLTIEAEDHDGKKETFTAHFHCHPM